MGRRRRISAWWWIASLGCAAFGTAPASAQQQAQNLVYTAVAPCRVADTRLAIGGALVAGDVRTFHVVGATSDFGAQGGQVGGCGLPGYLAGAPRITAVMFDFVAVAAQGAGNLRAWAFGTPPNASIINYTTAETVANGVIVPVDQDAQEGADLRIRADVSGTHLVIDVLGYFSPLALTDGAGSGLDADTLDGLEASAFAASAHQHAGEDVTTGTVAEPRIAPAVARDAEVLPLVLAGDGPGSGVDADLLDGLHASAFQRRYAKVATVAVNGTGDYADPVAAMNALATWCGTPSGTNRCLLRIMAGYYVLPAALVTTSLVDVAGTGQASTVLVRAGGSDPNTPAVIAAGGGEIRDLAIVSSGGSHTLGVLLAGSGRTLRNVYVSAQGSTDTATAVRITAGGSPVLEDCFVIAFGPATTMTGIEVSGPTMSLPTVRGTDVRTTDSATSQCRGVDISGASQVELVEPRVTAWKCDHAIGVRSAGTSTLRQIRGGRVWAGFSPAGNFAVDVGPGANLSLDGVQISAGADVGTTAVGLRDGSGDSNVNVSRTSVTGAVAVLVESDSLTRVQHSTLSGSDSAVETALAAGTARIAYSQLVGGVAGPGTHECLGAYDFQHDPLASDCGP